MSEHDGELVVLDTTPPEQQHVDAPPAWWEDVLRDVAQWLTLGHVTDNTRTAYATAVGLPRDRQVWRTSTRKPRTDTTRPAAFSFLAFCARYHLDPYRDVDREALRAWITWTRSPETNGGREPSDATVRQRLAAVGAFYTEARERGRTTFSADVLSTKSRRALRLTKTDPKTPTVPVTEQQMAALRRAAKSDPSPERLRNIALIGLLTTTGLRAAELCELRRGDVRESGPDGAPAVRVLRKGGKRQWISVGRAEFDAITAYLADRDQRDVGTDVVLAGQHAGRSRADERVFLGATGAPMSVKTITQTVRRLCRVPGRITPQRGRVARDAALLAPLADTLSPHQFRHGVAVALDAAGFSAPEIQKLLGHESLATTQRYLAGVQDVSARAVTALSARLAAADE